MNMKKLIAVAGLAAAAVVSSQSAQAVPLTFTLSGDVDFTFTLDSDPVPVNATLGLSTIEILGDPNLDFVNFPSDTFGDGGLTGLKGRNSPFAFSGVQIFSSTPYAPHFSPGTFILTFNINTNAAANETLTITGPAATPVPPALPLFVSALGGVGLLGWFRKRAASA